VPLWLILAPSYFHLKCSCPAQLCPYILLLDDLLKHFPLPSNPIPSICIQFIGSTYCQDLFLEGVINWKLNKHNHLFTWMPWWLLLIFIIGERGVHLHTSSSLQVQFQISPSYIKNLQVHLHLNSTQSLSTIIFNKCKLPLSTIHMTIITSKPFLYFHSLNIQSPSKLYHTILYLHCHA
jgi:hypothetical protein